MIAFDPGNISSYEHTILSLPEIGNELLVQGQALLDINNESGSVTVTYNDRTETVSRGRGVARDTSQRTGTEIAAMVGVLASQATDNSQLHIEHTVDDLIKRHRMPSTENVNRIRQTLVADADSYVKIFGIYEQMSATFFEVEASIQNNSIDDQAQFRLLQILAQRTNENFSSPDNVANLALHIGSAYYALKNNTDGGIHGTLNHKLQKGYFDSFLGDELFVDVTSLDISATPPEKLDDLSRVTLLIMRAAQMSVAESVQFMNTPDMRQIWPASVLKELGALRTHYGARLENNFQYYLDRLLANGIGALKRGEESLDETFLDYILALQRSHTNLQLLPRTIEVEHESRKRRRKSRTSQESTSLPAAEAESAPEPYELYVSSQKIVHNADKSRELLEKMKQDYLGRHPNHDNVTQSLENVLEWLQKLDMSKGRVKGIKKYGYQFDDGGTLRDVFGCKPSDIPGLTTPWHIKDVRIIFVLNHDNGGKKLGILFLDDRSAVVSWERRHNIKTAKR